jgi:hypothetical protein
MNSLEKVFHHLIPYLAALLVLSACAGVGRPSPQSLIQRHIEVVYLGKGIGAQPSITLHGRLVIEAQGVDAPLILKAEAPDKRYFKTVLMGKGVMRGCKGEAVIRTCKAGHCWTKEVSSPIQPLQGGELDFMAELADFYRLQHLQRYYRHMETAGLTTFNGERAYELRLIRNNGWQDSWYFSRDSGLWLGGTWRLPRDMGGGQITQYFDRYRTFDGIQVATEITDVTPGQTSKIIVETASFEDIPDSVFALTANTASQ